MAKQNKSVNDTIESMKRFEKACPGFKFGKAGRKKYDPETINSEIESLSKSRSMNGEEAKELAKAAKERGKSDGFIAGALIVGIAWASHAATNWVMEKFSKA